MIELDTALFRYPFRVAVKDSIAIVMDLHNADNYFHAFTYPNWKHIVSFGKRGEGPEEMLSAETFQFNSLDSIYALDANKMQISRWAISAKDHSATRQEVIRLDKNLIRSLDFCATDSCFLIPSTDIGKSITVVNLSEASVKYLPKKIWLRKSARH